MKFDSASGQELRTWILFVVGIALVVFFALNGTTLNPWWTLVIGAFTCTAVLVSAVSTLVGGKTNVSNQPPTNGGSKSDQDHSGQTNTRARLRRFLEPFGCDSVYSFL